MITEKQIQEIVYTVTTSSETLSYVRIQDDVMKDERDRRRSMERFKAWLTQELEVICNE